nr:MAG: hypothetical protein DIU73_03850 [Actinomycetota bacterium]
MRAEIVPADGPAPAVPFLPGDIIKLFLAASVAYAVHRAYPQILADQRASDSADAPQDGADEALSETA